jgi:hypothetical protein
MLELLGYAQFPGGPPETDGVVVDYLSFGTMGTAKEPFHLGRTATHEIGHWLNLYHIWGDDGMGCAGDDLVDDTPNQAGPNQGMPGFPHVTCDNGPNGDMFVNYMDYTDDAGMIMFTEGQCLRMQSTLDGPRATIDGGVVTPPDNGGPTPPDNGGPTPPDNGGPVAPGVWKHTDLSERTGAKDAAGDPVVAATPDGLHVLYRGLDEHIHDLHLRGG